MLCQAWSYRERSRRGGELPQGGLDHSATFSKEGVLQIDNGHNRCCHKHPSTHTRHPLVAPQSDTLQQHIELSCPRRSIWRPWLGLMFTWRREENVTKHPLPAPNHQPMLRHHLRLPGSSGEPLHARLQRRSLRVPDLYLCGWAASELKATKT